jgi:hypothetical protein
MSVKTQTGKTVMIIATIIPNGFSNSDSITFPFKSITIARVVPQDGQGKVVTLLIIQKLKASFWEL